MAEIEQRDLIEIEETEFLTNEVVDNSGMS